MTTAQVTSVVGARPQFVKLAPMARALDRASVRHEIIHTGQHYDDRMSASFFRDLGIAEPSKNLAIGSGSHGAQTGQMLAALDAEFSHNPPAAVLVYGDTNTTVAAALAAAKRQISVIHLEAGLRSSDRAMPEEINRILTDHASDLLLAPTKVAMDHLAREGLQARSRLVGDVMVDACFYAKERVEKNGTELPPEIPSGPFVFCTLHRPVNVDEPRRLTHILNALRLIPMPVVIAAHPRLVAAAERTHVVLTSGNDNIRVVPPLTYLQTVSLLLRAVGIVTDSGGLQKEAFLLGSPCTTVRNTTEWPETLEGGWNVLNNECINLDQDAVRPSPSPVSANPYGQGDAADQAVSAMMQSGLLND